MTGDRMLDWLLGEKCEICRRRGRRGVKLFTWVKMGVRQPGVYHRHCLLPALGREGRR